MSLDKNTNLFSDLATLCEAGISVADAAKRVTLNKPFDQVWPEVIKSLQAGRQLNIALSKQGLLSPFEQEIIYVAEFSGRLPQGLRAIAISYDKRRQRVSKLKSKLYFPFSVLVIAIVVSSILQITNQPESSLFMIFVSVFFWIGLALFTTQSLLNLMQKDACYWLKTAKFLVQKEWYKMQFQQVVFSALVWQIKSGIDFKTGFIRITQLLNDPAISKKLKQASLFCAQGKAVTESIIKSQLPISNDFKQILNTAEQSGQWEFAVEKYLLQQQQLLEQKIDNLFEWTPRIYYGLIAVLAISVIL